MATTQLIDSTLSTSERAKAEACLRESCEQLLTTLASLSDRQWTFKAAPERWSILENLEHLVLVEARVHDVLARMTGAPVVGPDDTMDSEEQVLALEVRTQRFVGPPAARPTGNAGAAEAIENFKVLRTETLALLDSATLHGHYLPHPIRGPWDGYRWVLGVSAHTKRHLHQIEEVMADPAFPQG